MPVDWRGWVPNKLRLQTAGTECEWLYVGSEPFAEPFFEETAARCLRLTENSAPERRVSSLDALPAIAHATDSVPPAVLIFHVSRCGSTLLSQLLGALPGVVSLSEVPFFDQLLRAHHRASGTELRFDPSLKAAVELYSGRRTGQERAAVIKLDSWHLCFYDRLRRLYPTTPFILLYREPAAVIASHRKVPGQQAVPGLIEDAVLGLPPSEDNSFFDHLPRVLAKFYEEILRIAQTESRSLLVRYEEDMLPVARTVLDFIGWPASAAIARAWEDRTRFHGKRAGETFTPLATVETSSSLLPAVLLCRERYEALEAFRRRSSSSSA